MPLLARTTLFDGLGERELAAISARMQPRHFPARAVICRQHEPGDSLFVILKGLALVSVTQAPELDPDTGSMEVVARLRRGDVVGEMSLITGEPRSATVTAVVPTDVLELRQDVFASVLGEYPAILLNLNRILSRRLARSNLRPMQAARRGEAVALLLGRAAAGLLPAIVAATDGAAPRGASVLLIGHLFDPDTNDPMEVTLAALDDLLADRGTVLIATDLDPNSGSLLAEHVDRVVAVGDERELATLAPALGYPGTGDSGTGHGSHRYEGFLLAPSGAPRVPAPPPVSWGDHLTMVKSLDPGSSRDIAWLGRHLSRTKLGLALGAGGAKGYAHVGALYALEAAGYTVDFVAGSSIGAIAGACLARGMRAAEIDATMRNAFTPEYVAQAFKLSFSGTSAGLDAHLQMCQDIGAGKTFGDLSIPLVVMTVDLDARRPAPISEGPLGEALVAATALAGMFPPCTIDGRRLIDGLALVPVPVGSVIEAGADITVSVNIMSREMLDAWPGEEPPEPPAAKSGSRMLDTLLEVMDLAQLDSSVRHAALADVTITPRFAPASWRDFHLADQFLAAGCQAAEEKLAALRPFAHPQSSQLYTEGDVHGAAIHL